MRIKLIQVLHSGIGHRRVTSLKSERLGNQLLVAKGKIMGDELITVYPPKNIYLEMFSKFPHYFQGDKKRQ